MGGPRQRGWAPIGLPSRFLSGLLGRMGSGNGAGLSFMFPGSDGWAVATGLGSHWAPFMFVFWAAGSDGWAAATGLGSQDWAPFMFPFWAPGSDGWAAATALGSLHVSFLPPVWLPGSDGWAAALGRASPFMFPFWGVGRAGLPLGSLHVGFWVGLVGHGNGVGLPLTPFMFPFWAPASDGWAAATGLGSHWAPFFLGSWVGWVGRGNGAGLPLTSLHVSFLGSWIGWVGRSNGAGLPLSSLHVSFLCWVGWVGRGNGAGLLLGSLHLSFLGGGPRQRGWAPIGLPSCFLSGSWVGWAAATGLRLFWAPFMFPFWAAG